MTDERALDDLEERTEGLNATLAETSALVGGFDSELRRMRGALEATGRDIAVLERGLSRGLRRAFDDVIFDGESLSNALDTVAESMVNAAYNAAIRPVTNQVGGVLAEGVSGLVDGILPFANGAPFSQGRVMPFASGGIVSGATPFGMRGGLGLMGEAGPEAIMPLARGADGKLGVRGAGSGGQNIVVNVTTPDVQGFQRSQGQIAAQVSRALARSQRNR
ncbi:MAG: phage tail tape measure protein [Pseudomonadota bacterium]